MMIHDVIGSIREQLLLLRKEIDGLKTAIHMLEWEVAGRPHRTSDVSRETVAGQGDGNGSSTQLTLFDADCASTTPKAGVGEDDPGPRARPNNARRRNKNRSDD